MKSHRNRGKITGRRESGSFLALPHRMLESPQYAALTARAVKLLIDIGAQYRGTNNGDLTATWSVMHARGWRSRDTLGRAKRELLSAGFIEKTRDGGLRFPVLYAISWRAVDECGGKLQIPASRMASNLWKQQPQVQDIQNPDTTGVSIRHGRRVEKAAA